MTPSPTQHEEDTGAREELSVRRTSKHEAGHGAGPRPWTAPDFVERSVCAEIGAYSFQER